jgi:hypothetical protein
VKLTVIIEDVGGAMHMGFAIGYRRVTLDLTPEQTAALALRHEHEGYGTTFIERDAPPPRSEESGS